MIPGSIRRIAAPALVAAIALALAACSNTGGVTPSPSVGGSTGAGAGGPCPTSQPPALAKGETRTVTIQTEKGSIAIKIEADLSPIAAGNFVALASCGFFDGVVFHRVATLQDGTPFVIQGGDGQYGRSPNVDPQRAGTGGPGYE
ncbi:MAG: peptidylprolyl isomerase, partial [Candidatus Limnocylindrales bacterium]